MAANVRALLDAEGPRTKAVLWAHNGHVQRSPSVFFKVIELTNMGSHLHTMFGPEMVVIGFAFNQGSFQAVDGTGKLRDHTVPPAPEGFVDAALAATGLPLLALDLANMPPDGPVAKWLAARPSQRSIGAVFYGDHSNYSEAANPRTKYDILLFVDRTTTARANPKVSYPAPGNGSHGEPTNLALSGSGPHPDGWRALNFSRQPYAVTVAEEETPEAGRAVRLARGDGALIWGDGGLAPPARGLQRGHARRVAAHRSWCPACRAVPGEERTGRTGGAVGSASALRALDPARDSGRHPGQGRADSDLPDRDRRRGGLVRRPRSP